MSLKNGSNRIGWNRRGPSDAELAAFAFARSEREFERKCDEIIYVLRDVMSDEEWNAWFDEQPDVCSWGERFGIYAQKHAELLDRIEQDDASLRLEGVR